MQSSGFSILSGPHVAELKEHFAPHQLGIGMKGGAEIEAHAGRVCYSGAHPGLRVLLKLDFRDAFNEIRHNCIIKGLPRLIRIGASFRGIRSVQRCSRWWFSPLSTIWSWS